MFFILRSKYFLVYIVEYFFQEADFGVAQITVTRNRSDVVDFMNPFWQESQTFMIKMPTEDKIMLYANLFKVFPTFKELSRLRFFRSKLLRELLRERFCVLQSQ